MRRPRPQLVKSNLADATARNIDVLIELVDTGILDINNHQVIVDHILEELNLGERIVLVALVPARWSGVMLSSTATRG